MPTDKLMYRRRFLNRARHHSGAHVIASIDLVRNKKGRSYVDGGFRVADCYRVVELDFTIHTRADAKNALHKAKLLRELLEEFTDSLEKAIAQWEDLD